MKALTSYYSRTGHAEAMARTVAEGVEEEGVLSEVKKIEETTTEDLLRADCIVMGCPTY